MSEKNAFEGAFDDWNKLVREGKCPMCALPWKGEEVKQRCAEGKHCWDIETLGGGSASFSCMHCAAHSNGSMEPLRQHGFEPRQGEVGEVWVREGDKK